MLPGSVGNSIFLMIVLYRLVERLKIRTTVKGYIPDRKMSQHFDLADGSVFAQVTDLASWRLLNQSYSRKDH